MSKIIQTKTENYLIVSRARPEYEMGLGGKKYECYVFKLDQDKEVSDWCVVDVELTDDIYELLQIHEKMIAKWV